jgi:hypothetical protein
MPADAVRILGVDFTSAPCRRKPITAAFGTLRDTALAIERVERIADFDGFERLLRMSGPWVGGFDFPFGLPRELVVALGWPMEWPALIRHYAALDREAIALAFSTFRSNRPAGSKYATRAQDASSGAHSSMKLVNPPVGWMLRAGVPRLLDAGVHLPGLHDGDRTRVALEAYPGFVMRKIAQAHGARRAPSYKNDSPGKQTSAHREARRFLLRGLVRGPHPLDIATSLPRAMARSVLDDPSGDTLDAIAAAVQAAWGARRVDLGYGMPPRVDPLEGWIVATG